MEILLNSEEEKFVLEKVKQGYYNSINEVFNESLKLLEKCDHFASIQTKDLLQELKLGFGKIRQGKIITKKTQERLELISLEIKRRNFAKV